MCRMAGSCALGHSARDEGGECADVMGVGGGALGNGLVGVWGGDDATEDGDEPASSSHESAMGAGVEVVVLAVWARGDGEMESL